MAELPSSAGLPPDEGTRSHPFLASWIVVAIPTVIVLVGAWSYRWVQEDAFINFRIIDNLLAGHGPVYNVGERVEVYSDPLWLFLVAGFHEVFPFMSLEWLAVFLGLGTTGTGVVLSGRAIQRLGEQRGDGLVVPVGLLVFAVVAGVWEFSTSGLEMGLVFCWIGLSFWLIVRMEKIGRSATLAAFVAGLGPLIRPELLLMSVAYLAVVGLIVSSRHWKGPKSFWRGYLVPLLAAVALPVIYELWRMAYFAMVVPNTALAKSASSSWWSQGLTYLWNFVAPYSLWIPFALASLLVVPRLYRWLRRDDRIGVAVLAAPMVGALLDVLYVTRLWATTNMLAYSCPVSWRSAFRFTSKSRSFARFWLCPSLESWHGRLSVPDGFDSSRVGYCSRTME